MVHVVHQYSEIVVADDGKRYIARAYAAPRPYGLWDGWFVFLPLDDGRTLATDWETTQSNLAGVKYWSEGITFVYLEGALRRAWALRPEARLDRRVQRAEQEEALAKATAAAYEHAAAAARAAATEAKRERRDAEARLLADRAAAARAAAILQEKAAAKARAEAAAAERRRRALGHQPSGGIRSARPSAVQPTGSAHRAHSSHRRRD